MKVEQIHRLTYGDYLTSHGTIEKVLMIVDQKTDVKEMDIDYIKLRRSCKNCPVYDKMNQEIIDLLETQNPGNLNQFQDIL